MSSDFPSRGLDKFVLRMPEGMRERIGAAARANKRTMNAEIIQRLEESFTSSVGVPNFLSEQDIIQMIIETHQMLKQGREGPTRAPIAATLPQEK